MALNDHYLLTMRGERTFDALAIQNAFCYEMTAGIGTASELAAAFAEDIVSPILDRLHSAYRLIDLYIVNLDDLDDFGTFPIDEPGVQGGEYLPVYNAWGFEYIRTTRAIRNGSKRFSIVAEAAQTNGAATIEEQAALEALAVTLGNTISAVTTSPIFTPRLWKRPGTYDTGIVTAPGAFYPISVVRYVGMTTQNSRKPGRGV